MQPDGRAYINEMHLDEKDPITTRLLFSILCSGMIILTPIQQDLLGGFFSNKIKCPVHTYRIKYAMSSSGIYIEINDALRKLRHHFKSHGIRNLADFCAI
jgi:hypothetical protein